MVRPKIQNILNTCAADCGGARRPAAPPPSPTNRQYFFTSSIVSISFLLSNLFRQAAEGGAETVGLGFVVVQDSILKQGVKSLERLYCIVSLRHRHSPVAMGSARLSLRFSVSWFSFLVSLRLAECNYILMVMIYLIGIWIPKRI